MSYKSKIDSIAKKYNLDSDVERKQAYQECLAYAEQHYADTYDINPFLKEAADRFGQQYVNKNAIYRMVKSDGSEKATLDYSESNGPTLTANRSGLKLLSNLFLALSKCKMEGEHIHLWNNTHPMSGNTYPLTIYYENDNWFSQNEEEQPKKQADSKNIPTRDVNPASVTGLVFTTPAPPSISLTHMRFYKVNGFKKYDGQKVWRKTIRENNDRMMIFAFLDDTKTEIEFALDLDDKEILLLS